MKPTDLIPVAVFAAGIVIGYAGGTHAVPDTVSALPTNYDAHRAAFNDALKATDTCWRAVVNKLEKDAH